MITIDPLIEDRIPPIPLLFDWATTDARTRAALATILRYRAQMGAADLHERAVLANLVQFEERKAETLRRQAEAEAARRSQVQGWRTYTFNGTSNHGTGSVYGV